ncbi:N-formylglutamate deformylase [Citreimonas salinaria]|uniref:N-formylglutamate deformylase n=2 Tax=Citreimonas salinaria TaxID=321339 RepID=A0A1H3MAN8_9RHOB|nr:N-formylglutamate deformylase [Citreimonas salinaria]
MAAFALHRPDRLTSRVVFASPHSGNDYPEALLRDSVLDRHAIRSSEDAFVDRLFDCAPEFGAPLLAAAAPRAYVDLNRAANELDPALIEGIRRGPHNPRVASGLGVIPRVVANGRAIYCGKIPEAEAMDRLERVWAPYHARLQQLLDDAHDAHGEAILIDCHSMPHEAVASLARGGRRAEVVIGDRFGASAGAGIVDRIEAAFVAQGFVVARNAPFAGAYTTQQYGRPGRARHAVQVEIDRALYMDEATIRPHDGFEPLRAALRGVIAEIASLGQHEMPLAAE